MEFYRFNRWDNPHGVIADVREAYHYAEAGGENSLEITTRSQLYKGDRIVWRDDSGVWHEHVANEPSVSRSEDGAVLYTTYCEDALNEVFRDKVDEKRIRGGTSSAALSQVLQQTRWVQGTVNVTGLRTKSFYHCSVGEALQSIAKTWGGEIYSSFEVDDSGITKRKVNFVTAMGSRSTRKRFEYRKDLLTVKRTVSSDDVYTAMRGYGKGESLGDDEWGRRITFANINGGKDYVEDTNALAVWGRPDGKGGMLHSFGTVIFSDCEDETELKELTQQELDANKDQKVSYECEVLDDYEGTAVGDTVPVIDAAFSPTLRLEARVMSIKKNLLDPSDATITIGNIRNSIGDEMASQAALINSLTRRSSSYDVAVSTPGSYINQIMSGINKQFDAGMSYVYQSPEQGIVIGSVPLDQATGKPTKTPASAIQLKGGGFRIANAVGADGSFEWRTFGTGAGFIADEIIAGVLSGAGDCWWNLNDGTIHFGNDTSYMAFGEEGKLIVAADQIFLGSNNVQTAIESKVDSSGYNTWKSLTDANIANRVPKGDVTVQLNAETGTLKLTGSRLVIDSSYMSLNSGGHMTVYGACESEGNNGGIYGATQLYKGQLHFWNNSKSTDYSMFRLWQDQNAEYLNMSPQLGLTSGLRVWGKLSVLGTKNRTVKTDDYGMVNLGAYETPTPRFGDFGTAICDGDGICTVQVDPTWLQTVADGHEFHVIATSSMHGECWIEKGYECFTVHAQPCSKVDYMLSAPQRGFDTVRFEREVDVEPSQDVPSDWIFEQEKLIADAGINYYQEYEGSFENL